MRTILLAFVLAFPLIPFSGEADAASAPAQGAAVSRAISFLELQLATTVPNEYVVEAIINTGIDPGLWPNAATNLVDALVVPPVGNPGNDPIREIHAIAQSGYDPYHYRGRDLVADLKAAWDRSNQGVGQAAFTLLGLHAAGVPRGDATLEAVISLLQRGQLPDGGWSCLGLSSPDCTGFALTALRSEEAFLPAMADRAHTYLDQARLPNGGYGSGGHLPGDPLAILGQPGEEANTQSTVWALHGYRAIDDQPPLSVMEYLLSRQMPDGGFAWRDRDVTSNLWATTEVVAGLTRSFHELPVFRESEMAVPESIRVWTPAPFSMEPASSATWRILDQPGEAITGNPADLVFAIPGTSTVHVEAAVAGGHHREKREVIVSNSAPSFLDLPGELIANRVDGISLLPRAVDPEGDTIEVEWAFGQATGIGAVSVVASELGRFLLTFTARDTHGASSTADVWVVVENIPPILEVASVPAVGIQGQPMTLTATASDRDGPVPSISWVSGDIVETGMKATLSLTPGTHWIMVTASDADGATATIERMVTITAATGSADSVLHHTTSGESIPLDTEPLPSGASAREENGEGAPDPRPPESGSGSGTDLEAPATIPTMKAAQTPGMGWVTVVAGALFGVMLRRWTTR